MKYVVILFILLWILRVFKPNIKGYFGERRISKYIQQLPDNKYKVINDVLLSTDRGTTQIDHVVCSIYGIFVIETKNYKGWITGSERGEYWTQTIYKNKNRFRNPIHQNYGHKKALEQLLGDKHFIMIVAFSEDADIKVKTVKEHVIYMNEINKCIRECSTQVLYTIDEVNAMVSLIEQHRLREKEDKKAHVASTQYKAAETNQKIENHICPRCGGTLLLRHGKYGDFYGCSNFPKCRYTSKV